jgi:HlyD family secretion protein
MKKKTWLVLAIVLTLLSGGGLGYRAWAASRASSTDSVQTTEITVGSLASTLGASGNTRSGQNATITWETSGKVAQVSLKPGDAVQVNQLLAELDSSSLSTDMIKAKQDLIDAQQALEDLLNSRSQQAQALQALEDAQNTVNSLKRQAAEESSQAQLALAQAQDALEDAQKTRSKMDYPHSTDKLVIEKAQTDYELAKQAYKEALQAYQLVDHKKLTNPERVQALNRLVSAEANMKTKLATYNWYLLGYTETEITQADAELAVAQANLESAQANYDSLKTGTSEARLALAEATLADAQREWERVKDGPNQADLDAAQAAVDAAQATLDKVQLLAPFSGILTQVEVKTGDLVSSGETAFRIDDLSAIYIDLQISEIDLASIVVGQPAEIEFDAIADKTYAGEVTEIGMIGSNSQGVVNYPVTVRITDADSKILPGMTASVTIVTAQVDNVLLVPNKAIRTQSGQKYVTVLFEGQQISVPVQVGLVGDSQSEIISDQLREGDAVVINGSTTTTTTAATQRDIQFIGGGEIMGPPGAMP